MVFPYGILSISLYTLFAKLEAFTLYFKVNFFLSPLKYSSNSINSFANLPLDLSPFKLKYSIPCKLSSSKKSSSARRPKLPMGDSYSLLNNFEMLIPPNHLH